MPTIPDASRPGFPDLLADVVRALVLYSFAEHQAGHASTIRVSAEGTSFSVADDGRGHSIERLVGQTSYLAFVYTHLDYPFEAGQGDPIQLQGIGMSLINTLCSELSVRVQKPHATLVLSFREGRFVGRELLDLKSEHAGNTVAGVLDLRYQRLGVDTGHLGRWLRTLLAASRGLTLFFNGQKL